MRIQLRWDADTCAYVTSGGVEREPRKRTHHACRCCRARRAHFRRRGHRHTKARRDHDLCKRCFRQHLAIYRRWSRHNTHNGWMVWGSAGQSALTRTATKRLGPR